MSHCDPAAADYLSTCYREIARALRKVIPTLRYIKSREELESVAVCYERLAEHRDNVCLVGEPAPESDCLYAERSKY
jgi:hypothetical protein